MRKKKNKNQNINYYKINYEIQEKKHFFLNLISNKKDGNTKRNSTKLEFIQKINYPIFLGGLFSLAILVFLKLNLLIIVIDIGLLICFFIYIKFIKYRYICKIEDSRIQNISNLKAFFLKSSIYSLIIITTILILIISTFFSIIYY